MSDDGSRVKDARVESLPPREPPPGQARILILGSMPGVASLRAQQYYGHSQNAFWKILGELWGLPLAQRPYAERVQALRAHGLGLWDVYASCEREGSLDSAIRDPQPNDLAALVAGLPDLRGIAHNGGESARTMRLTRQLGPPVFRLPSTSPANASWSFERKLDAWRQALVQAGLPVKA